MSTNKMCYNSEKFYRDFQNKFRGSRSDILHRLHVYLPFILPLNENLPTNKSLDCGCGRGEFLELMALNGLSAEGVDIDDDFWPERQKFGVKIHKADALTYLDNIAKNSLAVVSAIQLIEHLDAENQKKFIASAYEALAPGGLLIIETPNCENIRVSSKEFFLDPTHIRPLPADLLEYYVLKSNFHRSKIIRIFSPQNTDDLNKSTPYANIYAAVSPDYAIVAQKLAEDAILKPFDDAFSKSYGLTIDEIISQTDQEWNRLVHEDRLLNVNLQKEVTLLRKEIDSAQVSVKNEMGSLQGEISYLQEETLSVKKEITAIKFQFTTSRSWQVSLWFRAPSLMISILFSHGLSRRQKIHYLTSDIDSIPLSLFTLPWKLLLWAYRLASLNKQRRKLAIWQVKNFFSAKEKHSTDNIATENEENIKLSYEAKKILARLHSCAEKHEIN